MKKLCLLLVVGFAIASCARKGAEAPEQGDEANSDSTLQVLYNEVMDIHDEVMPRMEDLYNLKKDLEKKIADSPGMVIEERRRLEERIARIDSVSDMMMDWMHEFTPLPDTVDQDQSRAYLESEMEKIRRVKTAMLETLDEGN